MKAYKLEILVVDFDEVGASIPEMIENANYPNHCISPHVMSVKEADIGKWDDEHPLNKRDTMKEYYKEIFKA